MTLNQAITICLFEKYASFAGRASRSEYWWFGLAMLIYILVVMLVFFVVNFIAGGFAKVSGLSSLGLLVLLVGLIGYLALILPALAVTVRRLHDVNLSGWWLLAVLVLGAVPLVGWIARAAILVVTLVKGTTGENRFGDAPFTRV